VLDWRHFLLAHFKNAKLYFPTGCNRHSKQYDDNKKNLKTCFVTHLPFSCPPLGISSFCSTGSYFESACLQGNTPPLCKCSKDVSWCFAWKTTCILHTYSHRSVCLWNGRRTLRRFPCPCLPSTASSVILPSASPRWVILKVPAMT